MSFCRSHCIAAVLATALLLLVAPTPAVAAGRLSAQRRAEILRDALSAFDEAVASGQKDPATAADQYRRSAAAFEALIDDGVSNAGIEYNLANAYARLGDTGKAILHYRRALRLDPSDAKLSANLAYIRNRVQPVITESGRSLVAQNLLFWHHGTSLQSRFWAAAGLSAFGWLWLATRLWNRRLPLSPGILCAVLGLVAGLSASWEIYDASLRPAAVIISGQHTLRLGRGDGADPAMREPLGPGVELRVLNRYADWVEVRLNNGQTGWLPEAAIEDV